MIKQVFGPLVGSIRGDESIDGQRYEEEYYVEFEPNSTKRPLADIYTTDRLPKYGSIYLANPRAYCRSARAEQLINHKWVYRVQVVYATEDAEEQQRNPEEPWEWPVTSRTDWTERELFLGKDLDGKDFKNAAGTPFVPPPPIKCWEPTVTFSYNTRAFSLWEMDKYAGATNNAPWFNQKEYAWRCVPRGVGEARTPRGARYLQVSVAFERWIHPQTKDGMWHPHKEPNVGYYSLGGSDVSTPTDVLAPILDDNHNPITEPRYLRPDGKHFAIRYEIPNDIAFRVRGLESFSVFDIWLRAAGF